MLKAILGITAIGGYVAWVRQSSRPLQPSQPVKLSFPKKPDLEPTGKFVYCYYGHSCNLKGCKSCYCHNPMATGTLKNEIMSYGSVRNVPYSIAEDIY